MTTADAVVGGAQEGPGRRGETWPRRLIDDLPGWVGVLARDGTVVDANRAWREALPPDQPALRQAIWETPVWRDASAAAWLREAVERTGRGDASRSDVSVPGGGDTPRWFDCQIVPLREEDGSIRELMFCAWEITARKRETEARAIGEPQVRNGHAAPKGESSARNLVVEANPSGRMEQALRDKETARKLMEERWRESEATQHSFHFNSPLLICVIELLADDSDIICVYSNPATERFMGLRKGDGTQKNGRAMGVSADFIDRCISECRTSELNHGPVRFNYFSRHDGGSVWLSCTVAWIGPSVSGRSRFSFVAEDITGAKIAEVRLKESEERFRGAFENAAIGMAHTAANGRYLAVNRTFCEITGYSAEELRAKKFSDITYPPDLEQDWTLSRRLLAGEIPNFSLEKRYVRKDGNLVWVEITVSVFRNASGKPLHFIVTIVDISARKAAQTRLSESEERLRRASHAARVGIWEWNTTTGNSYWSPKACELFGCDSCVVTYESWVASLHPDDREHVIAKALAAVEQARVMSDAPGYQDCFRVRHADGKELWLESVGAFVKQEGCLLMMGAVRDVSVQKYAELALKQERERLALALLAGRMGSWSWDRVTQQLEWSSEIYQVFGQPLEFRPTVEAFKAIVHPDDREAWWEAFAAAEKESRPFVHEFRIHWPDGNIRWIANRAHTYRDAHGRVQLTFGLAFDITEQKMMDLALARAQQQLQRHADELEQTVSERTAELRATNEQLETFVYSIAHDLRAPLRAMTGYSAVLREDYAARLDEPGQHMLQRIQASSEFMDRMLLDLIAQGFVSHAAIELGPVSIRNAWDAALRQYADQIAETSALVVQPSGSLPIVRAHAPTLDQLLSNLVSNALKFAVPGMRPQIALRVEERGELVRLWVEDKGMGIPSEHHERIFRVFERLHGPRYGGTGIGLSIVRKGAERMGGRAGVESEPGQGSRFWIELAKAG